MNIALFASAFYPSLGGVEELCRQLALELMRQGHGVIVLTNRWPRDLPATETLDGIPVYRLPFRLPEGSAKAAINYHLTHRRIEREMLAILRAHKIDLLHVQCVSSNAHYAMIAQEKLNLPLVVTLHGELTMDANQIFQKSRQAQEILRRALDRADVITACSGKTLRDGEEFYGKPFGERGRVIFNGVNLADFGPSMTNDQKLGGDPGAHGVNSRHKDTKNDGFTTKTQRHEDGGGFTTEVGEGALRRNDQKSTNNEQKLIPARRETLNNTENTDNAECTDNTGAGFSSRRPYIFALGRMAKQKGFDVLIKAYAALRFNDQGSRVYPGAPGNNDQQNGQSVSSVKSVDENVSGRSVCGVDPVRAGVATPCFPDLILAGDGPELEPLKALARELGLGDYVHFPGRADRGQVASYMAGCEFFVISSPAEPFGIVVLEAMAAGAAVIAVNNAGPAEIITNGVNGLLVDRSEPEQLATAMRRLMGDGELRKRLAAGGRARAGEFSWPKIAHRYVAAYVVAATQELGVRS